MRRIVHSNNQRVDHEALPLPGGRKVSNVRHLTSLLVNLGVPGVSHEKGRYENVAAYEAHLETIRKHAADIAVQQWLEARKGIA